MLKLFFSIKFITLSVCLLSVPNSLTASSSSELSFLLNFCTVTCCQKCNPIICPLCSKEFSQRNDICPCTKEGSQQLLSVSTKSPLTITTNISMVSSKVPICRPSCCPRKDCTKSSCPACYKKLAKSPKLCPCVNTGKWSFYDVMTRRFNIILGEFSERNYKD